MIYEATVTYRGKNEKNREKGIKESVLCENYETFSEVENELRDKYSHCEDIDVVAIKRSNILEIANQRTSDDDVIWQAEVQDIFRDDEGNEKLLKYKILFFSKTYESANTFITEYAKQGYDMSLVSLKLTKFIDVI